jgi:hypothetical protein
VAGTLRAVRARTGPGWVMDELDAAWPVVPDLAAELRAAGTAPGPAHAELAAVGVACGLLALRDDPLHPAAVAHEWRSALPRAGLVETNLAAVGRDRATIGRGAVLAWLRAGVAAGEN